MTSIKEDTPVWFITGCSSGLGRALAERVLRHGHRCVASARKLSQIEPLVAPFPETGLAIELDVTDAAARERAVGAAEAKFGRIDVLVNNAGWDKVGSFVDSDEADWDRVIAINLYGVLHTSKAVLPIMAAQGHGHVVNLGSDAGRVGSSGEAVYSAAKGAVIAFSKATAREMARHQVNINCVCPGPTDTPLFASIGGDNPKLREALTKAIPFRRLADPSDLANAVAFFASDEAAYITGQTVSVSGGLTMS